MSDLRFEKINEYIFAPFNTFIYLDDDEMMFADVDLRDVLIKKLNDKLPLHLEKSGVRIEWTTEDSKEFKLSKGVFIPPGKDNSFIMARLVNNQSGERSLPIKETIIDLFPSNSIHFSDINFYFHEGGVGTVSVLVKIDKRDGLTILQLEAVSEFINGLYKQYFEEIAFQLTQQYVQAVKELNIPHHQFDFLPDINEIDKATHFIPWTHRIYHIQDDSLFELDNPG
ncbi:MAG: hypothetical protein ACFFBD_28980, partial [Candidatus Hodarchaeota archaeon]